MEEYTPKHSTDGGFFDKVKSFFTKNKKAITIASLAIVAAVLLIIAGIIIYNTFFSKGERYDQYKNSNAKTAAEIFAQVEEMEATGQEVKIENPIYFDKIQEDCPDVYAWIQIEGMDVIDYPIVQNTPTEGADIDYYLTRNINGETKRAGAIYTQWVNSKSFDDRNTLIYGHNMLNGTMFGQLKKFRDKTFFDEHRNIYIYTPNKVIQYEIISAFVYDDRHILDSFNFNVDVQCQEFFDTCLNPNSVTKQVLDGATLDAATDKIITLSTCTSNDTERYLVVGKLVKSVEVTPAANAE